MSDTPAKPAEQPADLIVLQLQLADLAARSMPTPPRDLQQARGPVMVIRGK